MLLPDIDLASDVCGLSDAISGAGSGLYIIAAFSAVDRVTTVLSREAPNRRP